MTWGVSEKYKLADFQEKTFFKKKSKCEKTLFVRTSVCPNFDASKEIDLVV